LHESLFCFSAKNMVETVLKEEKWIVC
jgi:hypothetical protein